MNAAALPVLMYHHVSPSPGLVTVSPQAFREQMGWLAQFGYRTIGCDDLAAFLAGEELPARSVLVTFDDGYLDNWLYAHPVLAEYGQHATLFIVTGWIGEGPLRKQTGCPNHVECKAAIAAGRADDVMLRWSEVEAMRETGTFEFHSHTHTHTRWDRRLPLGDERLAAIAGDLTKSREALAHRLGSASRHLCWPQGYHDEHYRRIAKEVGFDYLYTVEKGTCTPHTAADRIPRIVVKDRRDGWFRRRLWLYRHPRLAAGYLRLRGE